MRGSTEQRGTQRTETHTTRRRPKSETETSLRRWRVRQATWTCERETRVEPRAEEEIQAHAAMNQQVRDEKKKGREPVGPQKSEPMKTAQDGREPSRKDREHHEATGHVVHAEWCKRCVCGRGQSGHHRHNRGENKQNTVSRNGLGLFFVRDARGTRVALEASWGVDWS